jgi:hypothetical protein
VSLIGRYVVFCCVPLDAILLLRVCSGHFSVSGRFEKLKEVAEEYAFLLKSQGLANACAT